MPLMAKFPKVITAALIAAIALALAPGQTHSHPAAPGNSPYLTPTQDAEGDRQILIDLYYATGGDQWDYNDNWLSSAPIGQWIGVTTDARGRVTELSLSENNLSGPVPPELGNLTNLTILILDFTNLSGPIPPELGNLANLTTLYLGGNNLSGPVPPELGNLANLKALYLGGNNLSGPVPPELGNLANLKKLSLSENNLSGPVPPELGNLTNLKGLSLRQNNLSGPIPPELGNLYNLTTLYLSVNNLSGPVPPELGNLANLEALLLHENYLSGPVPPELGNLANLKDLWLTVNNLSGPVPPELGNLSNLEFLFLGGNNFTGCLPLELKHATMEYHDLFEVGLPFCAEAAPTAAPTPGPAPTWTPGAAAYANQRAHRYAHAGADLDANPHLDAGAAAHANQRAHRRAPAHDGSWGAGGEHPRLADGGGDGPAGGAYPVGGQLHRQAGDDPDVRPATALGGDGERGRAGRELFGALHRPVPSAIRGKQGIFPDGDPQPARRIGHRRPDGVVLWRRHRHPRHEVGDPDAAGGGIDGGAAGGPALDADEGGGGGDGAADPGGGQLHRQAGDDPEVRPASALGLVGERRRLRRGVFGPVRRHLQGAYGAAEVHRSGHGPQPVRRIQRQCPDGVVLRRRHRERDQEYGIAGVDGDGRRRARPRGVHARKSSGRGSRAAPTVRRLRTGKLRPRRPGPAGAAPAGAGGAGLAAGREASAAGGGAMKMADALPRYTGSRGSGECSGGSSSTALALKASMA